MKFLDREPEMRRLVGLARREGGGLRLVWGRRRVGKTRSRAVRKKFDADLGLSVSGIAGPGGGTPEKPVGLTWIGLSATTPAGSYLAAWSYIGQGTAGR